MMPEQTMEMVSGGVMLGRRIKSRRALLSLTQGQLADAAGVSRQTVAYVEQGRVDPTAGTLAKIARALGVTMDWLVHGDRQHVSAA